MDVDISSNNLLGFTGNVGIVRALHSPHVAYLKPVFKHILPKALSEICEKRPPDPIDYLARYLYQWADCELYYYEKAIFAKELQLMALQVEKETARRLARNEALKRETLALKYLTANKKALVRFLSQSSVSKASLSIRSKDSSFDSEVQAWAREHAVDEIGAGRSSIFAPYILPSSTSIRKRRITLGEVEEYHRRTRPSLFALMDDSDPSHLDSNLPRTRHKRKSGVGEDNEFDSLAARRRGRKHTQDEDNEFDSLAGRRRGRKLDDDNQFDSHISKSKSSSRSRKDRKYVVGQDSEYDISRGKFSGRQSRQGRGMSRKGKAGTEADYDRLDTIDDSYGAAAKLKYGFKVTPVRCSWYLAEPNILVCVHPVLGEIRATIPTRTPLSSTPKWWEENEYRFEVMYDHEIYAHPSPHFDDDKYQDIMVVWIDDEIPEEELLQEGGENSVDEA